MSKERAYHKENLRQDLIDAGLAYVGEHGHVSLSVRTLAQKVGVSPGAPYHHFPDRRSLLLAIAVEGFKQLVGGAVEITRSDLSGAGRLVALGMHFVEFADSHPRLMELMYESELSTPTHDLSLEEYQAIGQRAIRDAIEAALPELAPKDIEIRAVAFWSAMYGFAALRRKSNIQSFERFEMAPVDVARSVITQAATVATSKA